MGIKGKQIDSSSFLARALYTPTTSASISRTASGDLLLNIGYQQPGGTNGTITNIPLSAEPAGLNISTKQFDQVIRIGNIQNGDLAANFVQESDGGYRLDLNFPALAGIETTSRGAVYYYVDFAPGVVHPAGDYSGYLPSYQNIPVTSLAQMTYYVGTDIQTQSSAWPSHDHGITWKIIDANHPNYNVSHYWNVTNTNWPYGPEIPLNVNVEIKSAHFFYGYSNLFETSPYGAARWIGGKKTGSYNGYGYNYDIPNFVYTYKNFPSFAWIGGSIATIRGYFTGPWNLVLFNSQSNGNL